MARKKTANTPKPAKPAGKAMKKAATMSKGGLQVTRAKTNTRGEVRNQNPQQQGHPK